MPKVLDTQSVFETGEYRIKVDKDTGLVTVTVKATGKIVPQVSEAPTRTKLTNSWLMVIMTGLGVLSFVVVSYGRPAEELLGIGGQVFGFVAGATLLLMNLFKAEDLKASIVEAKLQASQAATQTVVTHEAVNHRMDAMNERIDEALSKAIEAAFLKGKKAGSDEANLRTDDLAAKQVEIGRT